MSSRVAPLSDFAPAPPKPARRWSWSPTAWLLAISSAAIFGVQYGNSRLLGSWHGFLHSAIANRFSALSFPPENPFFAGQRLPYYWFYQFAGYGLSRALRLDLLHALHLLSWLSLGIFVFFAGLIGRDFFRAKFAGAAVAGLALVGINPLGPVIAAAKHVVNGTPLVERSAGAVETTFLPDESADGLMTHPLLPAMYVGSDWHYGQNIAWFLDIGARAPALAMLMGMLYFVLSPGAGAARHAALAATAALSSAFSPVIGMGTAGVLCAVSLGLAVVSRISGHSTESDAWRSLMRRTGVCLAGAMLALPTSYHMFFRLSGTAGTSLKGAPLFYVAMVSASGLLLLALAFSAIRKSRGEVRAAFVTFTVSGVLLLLFVALIHLPEGNEHSLSNAAYCLLAIPAAALLDGTAGRRREVVRGLLLLLVCLPVTAGTLYSFATRPPMPIATQGGELIRTDTSGLEELYRWVRRETPRDSIFIADPERAVKMSGNVSELPAFTGRTLFTDTPNYLTTPNRDAAFRAELARGAVMGVALTGEQREYVAGLGRPVYIVSYRPEAAPSLAGLYGAPLFHQGIAAVFRMPGETHAR